MNKKKGKSGGLGRAEAAGAMVVIVLYIVTMLASYSSDPQLFMTQQFYFGIITFCLVAMILLFDKLTLECVRISKYVILGCVVSSFIMFVLVNVIVVNPSILAVAALSSVVPTAGLVIYQVMFIGVGEGLLHYVFIRLGYSVVKRWGIAILIGSCILGSLHIFAVGFVPLTLVFLTLIFVVIAALSMTPLLFGARPTEKKIHFSIIISSVVHMVYNVCLILMPKTAEAVATVVGV